MSINPLLPVFSDCLQASQIGPLAQGESPLPSRVLPAAIQKSILQENRETQTSTATDPEDRFFDWLPIGMDRAIKNIGERTKDIFTGIVHSRPPSPFPSPFPSDVEMIAVESEESEES